MNTDDKLYGLMAQAEDIQAHAVRLQKEAGEAFTALRQASAEVGKEMRSRGLFWAICGGCILLACGALITIGTRLTLTWTTARLRQEVDRLRVEVSVLEARAKKFEELGGKAIVTTCEGRMCIRVDNKASNYGSENESYMIIYGY